VPEDKRIRPLDRAGVCGCSGGMGGCRHSSYSKRRGTVRNLQ
jgi:hypothetical protein